MRAAVIGAGFGAGHLAWLADCPGVSVVALGHARNRDRARELAGRFGVPAVTSDCAALAARADVQLVVVASPPHTHLDLARPALERGAVVVVDKPLAHDLAAARRLAELAGACGSRTMVTFQWREHRGLRLLRDRLASGGLGELLLIDAVFHHDFLAVGGPTAWPWRHDPRTAGAGALADLGVHVFDLLRWVTGRTWAVEAARTVLAAAWRPSAGGPVRCDTDDAALVHLRAGGTGLPARVLVSRVTPGRRVLDVTAVGTAGAVQVTADPVDGSAVVVCSGRAGEPERQELAPSTLNPYHRLLHDLQTGSRSVPDVADGLASQVLMAEAAGLAGSPARPAGDPPTSRRSGRHQETRERNDP